MQNDLYALLELSEIDQKIHGLTKNKLEFPEAMEQLQGSILEEKQAALEITTRCKTLDEQNKALESDVVDLKEGLKKSEDKLKFIKTNAEYDAVHTEIAVHKAKIGQAEDQMLKNMATLEELAAQRKTAEERLNSESITQKESEIKALSEKLATLEGACDDEKKRRDEAAQKIDPKIVRVYDRLQQRSRNGRCVGLVTDARRTCGSCNIQLTAQKFIEVRRNNTLKQCEACGAILVWRKE